MKRVALAIVTIAALAACQNSQKAVINGQFFGVADKNIVLEELSPSGSKIIDSVHTSSDGKFNFEIDFSDKIYPTFYNVRYNTQFAPLLIEKGEVVDLSSIGNIYINYKVSGSKGSELLNLFNRQTVRHSIKLDSINQLYNSAPTNERIEELGREYAHQYIKLKQSAIAFVVRNSTSLVSIVPLYQPTYNGTMLFNEPTDIIYYRAIADSLETYYPQSPYVNSLRNDIKRVDNVYSMDSLLTAGLNAATEFPEIAMKDALGATHSLTALKGKVVLLSFTSSSEPKLKILNRELLAIYDKFHDQGFEIYQVYVDSNKAAWLKSISETRLPWIQVSDMLARESSSLSAFNVTQLPTYFLINKEGKLEAIKVDHSDLEKRVEKLINNAK